MNGEIELVPAQAAEVTPFAPTFAAIEALKATVLGWPRLVAKALLALLTPLTIDEMRATFPLIMISGTLNRFRNTGAHAELVDAFFLCVQRAGREILAAFLSDAEREGCFTPSTGSFHGALEATPNGLQAFFDMLLADIETERPPEGLQRCFINCMLDDARWTYGVAARAQQLTTLELLASQVVWRRSGKCRFDEVLNPPVRVLGEMLPGFTEAFLAELDRQRASSFAFRFGIAMLPGLSQASEGSALLIIAFLENRLRAAKAGYLIRELEQSLASCRRRSESADRAEHDDREDPLSEPFVLNGEGKA